jgi:hypothetical protein
MQLEDKEEKLKRFKTRLKLIEINNTNEENQFNGCTRQKQKEQTKNFARVSFLRTKTIDARLEHCF